MPSAYFHEVTARRAAARLPEPPGDAAMLALGAQGPDPLFFYRKLCLRQDHRVNRLGGRLHTQRTGRFLTRLIRLAARGSAAQRAYVLGFIAHYATDTVVHPFVYARNIDAKGHYDGQGHLALEAAFDTWLWQGEGHRGTPLPYHLFPEDGPLEEAAALLVQAVEEVFPEEPLTRAMALRSFRDVKKIERVLHTPHGVKYSVFWTLERAAFHPKAVTGLVSPPFLLSEDFLNQEYEPWYSPWEPDRTRTESVPELLEAAVERAAGWMALADRYWAGALPLAPVAETLGDLHYSSGLDCRRTERMGVSLD